MDKKDKLMCSICGSPIETEILTGWAGGHNAEPAARGRCCSECNVLVVIPFRIALMYRREVKP